MAHWNFRQPSSDWRRISNMYPFNQHQHRHQYDPSNPQLISSQRIHPQSHPLPTGPVYRDAPQPIPNRLHPPPQPHPPPSNPNSPFTNTPLTYSGHYDWRSYAPPPPHPQHYTPGPEAYATYRDQSYPLHNVHGQPYPYPTAMPSYRPLPIPYDENAISEPTLTTTATLPTPNGSSTIPILGSGPLKPLTTGAINSLMAHLGNGFQAPKDEREEGEEKLSPSTTSNQLDEADRKPSELVDNDFAHDPDLFKDAEADDENYIPTTRKVARKVKTKAKAAKKGKGTAKGKGKAAATSAGPSGKKLSVASSFNTVSAATSNSNAVAGPSSLRHSNHLSVSSTTTHIHPGLPQYMGDEEIFRDLKNVQYPLMPIPEGSFSDVNDLLILHPPSHSPTRKTHKPINQYSRGGEPIPHAGQSKWEMYTCRSCRKTYDGKNARSVARRHLQDKHGIPLSKQARRTRWDHEIDRPKDAEEAHERGKKCKRDWAKVTRQQRQLERLHADYLLQFGPTGLITSWRHPLIAPVFRDPNPPVIDDGVVFTRSDEVVIPTSLRESAALLTQFEIAVENDESLPFVSFEDLLSLDDGIESDAKITPFKLEATTSSGSIITLPTSPLRPNFQPYTSTPVSSMRNSSRSRNDSQHGPNQEEEHDQQSTDIDNEDAFLNGEDIDMSIFDDPTEQFYGLLAVENQAALDAAIATDVDGEDDEGDGPPPLWVEPSWQAWRDFPSTSSVGLARLAADLVNENNDVPLEATQPSQPDRDTTTPEARVEIDENAAADSLLNLQSSPIKADSSQSLSEANGDATTHNMAPPLPNQWSQQDWANNAHDFIADCSSRPSTYQHGKSMSASIKQPFLHRPGNLQRSMSNATLLLDDPFDLNTTPRANENGNSQSQSNSQELGSPSFSRNNSKGRPRSSSYRPHPSPSPLLDRKRKPLLPKHSNLSIPNRPTSFEMFTRPDTTSKTDNESSENVVKHTNSGSFATPVRPSRSNPPSSVGQWLQFSSPVDPAASLGLAPTHAVPTTPGLRMIIGQDTPDGGGLMSGKRRRGMATPQIR